MLTGTKDEAEAYMFSKASSVSPFYEVFQNNMDETSFDKKQKQIDLMLSQAKAAFFYDSETVRNYKEYQNCQVINITKLQ